MIWRSSYRKIIYWVKFCTEVWSLLKKRRLCSTSSNFQNIKSKIKKKKNSKTNESVWLTCTERWKIDKNCSHFLCLKISKKKKSKLFWKIQMEKKFFKFFLDGVAFFRINILDMSAAMPRLETPSVLEEFSSAKKKIQAMGQKYFSDLLFLHVFFVKFLTLKLLHQFWSNFLTLEIKF